MSLLPCRLSRCKSKRLWWFRLATKFSVSESPNARENSVKDSNKNWGLSKNFKVTFQCFDNRREFDLDKQIRPYQKAALLYLLACIIGKLIGQTERNSLRNAQFSDARKRYIRAAIDSLLDSDQTSLSGESRQVHAVRARRSFCAGFEECRRLLSPVVFIFCARYHRLMNK